MNDIKTYLDTVCEQIRFQKAHNFVKKELQDHIIDQVNAFEEEGIKKDIAIQKAVEEMGDPVLVGTELDRVHRPKLEWSIIILIALLSFAHIAVQYLFFYDVFAVDSLWKNILLMLVYTGIMILFYHIDFTVLSRHGKLWYWLYVAVILFLCRYGWVSGYFFDMDLSVSEPYAAVMGGFTDIYYELFSCPSPIKLPILIYFFPIILTTLLYHCRGKGYKAIFWCCCSILPVLFGCYHALSEIPCIIVSVVCLLLLCISILKNWFAVKKSHALLFTFFMTVVITVVSILMIVFITEGSALGYLGYMYRSNFYDYMKYIQSILQNNSMKGACLIGTGSEFYVKEYAGEALINGFDFLKQWIEYTPARILHYGGWLVLLPLLAIYFFFMIKGFLLIKKQKSQLGFMTATAILLTFLLISVWNIVANTGISVISMSNPLGIPFFSTSDSVNIVFFALMGILLSVFRTGHITTEESMQYKNKKYKKTQQPLISISENRIHISIPIPFQKNRNKKANQNE